MALVDPGDMICCICDEHIKNIDDKYKSFFDMDENGTTRTFAIKTQGKGKLPKGIYAICPACVLGTMYCLLENMQKPGGLKPSYCID